MPKNKRERIIALLVAGGKSERMQADLPKPYIKIGAHSMLRQTVKNFMLHPDIDGVRVVIRREHHMLYKQSVDGLMIFPCVIGGESRQDSVRRGLESIEHREPELVLVHDAARPNTSHALISRVVETLKTAKAVIPAMKVTDTLKRGAGGFIEGTVDREQLYTVQTPQGFHYATLLEAHHTLQGQSLTDDAALMEKMGEKVAMVDGEASNIKITTAGDLKTMQTMLNMDLETRVAMGYDVHQLVEHEMDTPPQKQTIKLCGVRVPHTHKLLGHSDADVGLHALVDAILGTISSGDIGQHFPPSDPRWKGADSDKFLLHAYQLLMARGGELVHLDVTLVCEAPKVSPYRQQMIEHIAQMLKLAPNRISVKATTSEKLGFTGRGEGIAAQAVVTVRLPRE